MFANAIEFEGVVYEKANSWSGYDHLLTEEICKAQKFWEKKIKKHREQQSVQEGAQVTQDIQGVQGTKFIMIF